MICNEPECNEDKELNPINFIPNKQMKNGYLPRCRVCSKILRNSKPKSYFYNYEIILGNGETKTGRIKSKSKPMAKKRLNLRFSKPKIEQLYTNPRATNKNISRK